MWTACASPNIVIIGVKNPLLNYIIYRPCFRLVYNRDNTHNQCHSYRVTFDLQEPICKSTPTSKQILTPHTHPRILAPLLAKYSRKINIFPKIRIRVCSFSAEMHSKVVPHIADHNNKSYNFLFSTT